MREKTSRLIRFLYTVIFSVYTCVIGVLFITQCVSIYHSAESHPYSVESISTHYAKIEAFVWVWFVLFVIGLVMELLFTCFGIKPKKERIGIPDDNVLQGLKNRLPKTQLSAPIWEKSNGYETRRKTVWCICLGLFAMSMCACVLFLVTKTYEPNSDKEFYLIHDAVVDRLVSGLPWMIGGILISVFAAVYESFNIKAQTAFLKAQTTKFVKSGGTLQKNEQKTLELAPSRKKEIAVLVVRISLAVVGVGLVILGIFNGSLGEMFLKAINICTQCIGLG